MKHIVYGIGTVVLSCSLFYVPPCSQPPPLSLETISPILAVNFHPFWRSNSYPSSVPTWGVLREEGEGRREKGDVRREAGIQRDRETGEGDKGTGDMETRDRETVAEETGDRETRKRETETGRHRDKETWIQKERESRAEKLKLCRETEN